MQLREAPGDSGTHLGGGCGDCATESGQWSALSSGYDSLRVAITNARSSSMSKFRAMGPMTSRSSRGRLGAMSGMEGTASPSSRSPPMLTGGRHVVPRHAHPGLCRQAGARPRQQRAVAGTADCGRQALRRGDGEVLVAGHHGQRGGGAARGRRGRGLRGVAARRQRPAGRGDAAGQRVPARLPRPGGVQLEGPAGRDDALEVVPRGRGRGRRPGPPYRTSRRGREAAAHAGGAGPQDCRPHGPSVGMGASHQQRVSRAVQPVDRRVPASLWRHRLRRGHGAGTRPHVGDGGGWPGGTRCK